MHVLPVFLVEQVREQNQDADGEQHEHSELPALLLRGLADLSGISFAGKINDEVEEDTEAAKPEGPRRVELGKTTLGN